MNSGISSRKGSMWMWLPGNHCSLLRISSRADAVGRPFPSPSRCHRRWNCPMTAMVCTVQRYAVGQEIRTWATSLPAIRNLLMGCGTASTAPRCALYPMRRWKRRGMAICFPSLTSHRLGNSLRYSWRTQGRKSLQWLFIRTRCTSSDFSSVIQSRAALSGLLCKVNHMVSCFMAR